MLDAFVQEHQVFMLLAYSSMNFPLFYAGSSSFRSYSLNLLLDRCISCPKNIQHTLFSSLTDGLTYSFLGLLGQL